MQFNLERTNLVRQHAWGTRVYIFSDATIPKGRGPAASKFWDRDIRLYIYIYGLTQSDQVQHVVGRGMFLGVNHATHPNGQVPASLYLGPHIRLYGST